MEIFTIATATVLTCFAVLLPCASSQTTSPHQLLAVRYILRPGDTLTLQYRLTPDLNQTVVVQPDGFISVNVAGDIKVSGLTVPQAHELIVHKDEASLNKPELNLILEEFTHPSVVIAGEVLKPGQIELKEHTTALSAVLLAGGFTESAKSGQVLLFRKVDDERLEVTKLNLTNLRRTSHLKNDVTLQPGDMILVPRDKVSRIEHYIRIIDFGAFINPLQTVQ
jgi:polysaccharide export outer membrane protein